MILLMKELIKYGEVRKQQYVYLSLSIKLNGTTFERAIFCIFGAYAKQQEPQTLAGQTDTRHNPRHATCDMRHALCVVGEATGDAR